MVQVNIFQDRIGSAVIIPTEDIIAGNFASFKLIYTAGYFGIDDTGGIKIVQRFAGDMAQPQFENPQAPNFTSVVASNGVELLCRYDTQDNLRPWSKALFIKANRGYLAEGDTISVTFGDRRNGSPGIRMQTFCEDTLEFKVLVDPFSTRDYVVLKENPTLKIVPGEAVRWVAVLPTQRAAGSPFRFCLKAEDLWGNPCQQLEREVSLNPSAQVLGLPKTVRLHPGRPIAVIENLSVSETTDLTIAVGDEKGEQLTTSNPLRISPAVDSGANSQNGTQTPTLWPFWADLHGQSEETVGTNSVYDYFRFGRDSAFLDALSHQGNDFQITKEFWQELQNVCQEFYEPGRFVTFPGYEWSGNTSLGGDHNVLYLNPGEPIYRSSHALLSDVSDADTDRFTSRALFDTLKDREVFIFAHVGGRYADLSLARSHELTPAVEIHSVHGTFEWLLHDAFALGMRPGVVANSDDHKGRPGASYPGAGTFGAYGGLTCYLCKELSREAIFNSLHQRHHYATTGARLLLEITVHTEGAPPAMMGDIVPTQEAEASLAIKALCGEPIERLEVYNGSHITATFRPYQAEDLGKRIRVYWQGAEYRGRGRKTTWDGELRLEGNHFTSAQPINFWNPEQCFISEEGHRVIWQSQTAGFFSGVEMKLKDPLQGNLSLQSRQLSCTIRIGEIGLEGLTYEAGGLEKKLRVFRLPDENRNLSVNRDLRVLLNKGDNALYVKLIQEDGHVAWSSPVYVVKR